MRIDRWTENTSFSMVNLSRSLALLAALIISSDAFAPRAPLNRQRAALLRPSTHLFAPSVKTPAASTSIALDASSRKSPVSPRPNILKRIIRRFDVLESAGFDPATVHTSGIIRRVKDMHNPITYMVLALLLGLKWKWCFQNPYYWFAFAFCVKWYRARYVFKIPVWDRQPNWNNIITSKEQEKDLKAFTCKNCGSTIFIAKTREFFFEGNTGIGGLGCFSCGAKGKENFENTREEIVEDVADFDDYFEYERPLDFVSRAERRAILKEAAGDEERANQLLVDRSGEDGPENPDIIDATVVEDTDETLETAAEDADVVADDVTEPEASDAPTEDAPEPKAEAPPAPKKKAPKKKKKKSPPPADEDFEDILDMDDF